MHPWQKARIDEERSIKKQFGTRTKKEIWKMDSRLKRFQDLAKKAVSVKTAQEEKEMMQLLDKARKYGLIKETEGLDAILDLKLPDIMNRRLQSVVFQKGMANSMLQARQFIVHEHVQVNGRTISAPSYLISLAEEGTVEFVRTSSLSDPEHPEREKAKKEEKADKETLAAIEEGKKDIKRKPEKKEKEKRGAQAEKKTKTKEEKAEKEESREEKKEGKETTSAEKGKTEPEESKKEASKAESK